MSQQNINIVDALDSGNQGMNVVNFFSEGAGITKEDLYSPGTEIIKPEHLPSYVDDVVEGYYVDSTHFYLDAQHTQPIIPDKEHIYEDITNHPTVMSYRWSGSAYFVAGANTAEGIEYNASLQSHRSGTVGEKLASLDSSKVDKIQGKGLSSNDFTNDYKKVTDSVYVVDSSYYLTETWTEQQIESFLLNYSNRDFLLVNYTPEDDPHTHIIKVLLSKTKYEREAMVEYTDWSGSFTDKTSGDIKQITLRLLRQRQPSVSWHKDVHIYPLQKQEQGKGLSTNDYTTAEKDKLGGIETGADVNTIETIKRNGTALTPDENKAVNIEVPTTAEELTYDPAAASHTTGSVGAQLSTLSIEVGVLSDLTTTAKTSLVAAVNEVNGAIGTIGTILDTINGQVI